MILLRKLAIRLMNRIQSRLGIDVQNLIVILELAGERSGHRCSSIGRSTAKLHDSRYTFGEAMPNVTHLECSLCAQRFEPNRVYNLCSCGGTLYVRYSLSAIKSTWPRESLRSGRTDLWRYLPILPPQRAESIVSLGEGMTPLIRTERLGAAIGSRDLWVKDEGLNPTASFKASGMTTAITIAKE